MSGATNSPHWQERRTTKHDEQLVQLTRRCKRITDQHCDVAPPSEAPLAPASPAHGLSRQGNTIYYGGQSTSFDAQSFRFATTDGCAPHGRIYAWDINDVYRLTAQSCGGSGCGGGYTGYGWVPMGVEAPWAFEWLAGGYATDGVRIYHQWNSGPVQTRAVREFEVFACGADATPFGFDGDSWFEGGHKLSRDEANAKLFGTEAPSF